MDSEPTKFASVGEYIENLSAKAMSHQLRVGYQKFRDPKTANDRYLFNFSLEGYESFGTQLGLSQMSVDTSRSAVTWDTFFPMFYLPNFRENSYIGGVSHLAIMLALKNLDSHFESVPYSFVVYAKETSPLRKEQLRKILGIEVGRELPTSLSFPEYLHRSLLYAEKKGFDVPFMEQRIKQVL